MSLLRYAIMVLLLRVGVAGGGGGGQFSWPVVHSQPLLSTVGVLVLLVGGGGEVQTGLLGVS